MRLAQECGRVGREEHLALADSDDERNAVLANPDEEPRVVVMDHDESEVPFERAEREPDCLDEVALVVALDEVRDRLGVGLGRERVAVRGELVRELAVVLDDPVEDDRDLRRVAAGERMRIRLGDPAVRRPARVPETGRRSRPVRARALFEIPERADRADVVESVAPRGARYPPSRSRGTRGARAPG